MERSGTQPSPSISPLILTFLNPAQTLRSSRLHTSVPQALHLDFQNSWLPVIFSDSHFPSSLKNQVCQLQQTAFKNILLDYTAVTSTFLTMPVCVPCRTQKGVEYLFFFSSFSLAINTLVWVKQASNTSCMKSPRGWTSPQHWPARAWTQLSSSLCQPEVHRICPSERRQSKS